VMERPWFMSAPHGNWQKGIVSLVIWYAQHGHDYSYIINKANDYGPKNGWDYDTKQFLNFATKLAKRDPHEL